MIEELSQGFFVGEYHVDPATRTLVGHGRAKRLSASALEVLLQMARRPGELVPRAELGRHLAARRGDAERALEEALQELRLALGDPAESASFIETLSELGCRLLVEPQPALIEGAAAESLEKPAARAGFVEQLRKRGVIEVLIAYIVVGWLLLQVADVTFDQLGLPPWAGTFVAFLVITGFPVALVLAWFVEWTDKGAVIDRNPDDRPTRRSFGKNYISIVGALAIAAVGVFVYDRYVGLPGEGVAGTETTTATAAAIDVDPNSIAVLPFLNIDGSDDTRVFSDGLTEDVINRLAKIPGLAVASRGDSFSLAPNSPSRDVRNRLRVAYYIEGSVRLTDDALRVVVQLIDSATGFHVLSRDFNRKPDDFFRLQDEITNLTVATLRVALPRGTQLSIESSTETTDIDAYIHYRRGMDAIYRPPSRDSMAAALASFRKALEMDPDYAAAHAGICMAHTSGYDVTLDPADIDAAESSCATALRLNPNLGVVHNALGDLYSQTGNYAEAERHYEAALSINPKDVEALIGLGKAYSTQGQVKEAEQQYRQAIGLQPGNWNAYNQLGNFLYFNGRYREAAEQYREVVSLDDQNVSGWTNLAVALMLSGDFAPAASASERAIAIEPTSTLYSNLGLLHYYLGELDEARAALDMAIELQPNNHLAWSNLGDVLTFAGEPDKAREAFLRAEQLAQDRLDVNKQDAGTMIDLAWIRAMLGNVEGAEESLARAGQASPGDPYVPFIDALVKLRKGERNAAFERLETAAEMGYPRALIAAEPHLEELRRERRFQDLVSQ